MSYYYVELNDQNIVKATLETFASIDKPNMIQTDRLRNDLLGWLYKDGQFFPPNE